jgi:transcriptional regulator with XRE-family HTH domain
MTSFRIAVSPSKRVAGRFIALVRRELLKAFAEEKACRGLSQADIAREIEVHRSVINRELRGLADITLGRVGELAYAMGRRPVLTLERIALSREVNISPQVSNVTVQSSSSSVELRSANTTYSKAA